MRSAELTGAVLATLHNVRFYLDFMTDLREAIASARLAVLAAEARDCLPDRELSEELPLSSESPGFHSPV